MVDVTSTGHQHRRRRKKNNARYPSPALLASLAAFIPPSVLARPVLLPFLYPSIPQSTSTSPPQQQPHRPKPKRSATASSSSTSTPSSSRQPAASASQAESEQRRADRIAYHYKADDSGSYRPTCWSLHGQSNCPRDDAVDDGSIAEPDMHEVVPGEQPDFHPTSTSTSPSTPTTTSSTTTTSSAAPASTTTVEPYTMTFEVSNIPPGWQKSGRTSFYSKNIIIGFSVTLAALICLTIVLCVIWRIRVARERRESERALKEKKRELGISSQTSDESSLYHDQDRESTRQRGLRRRRANVRADDEDEDGDENGDDHDDHDNGGAASHERHEPAMSERNGMSVTGRKRRTAFMRTFSGKMLTAPMKWKVNRRRRQQEQEPQQDDRATEVGDDDTERDEMDERSQPRRRDTTASRASVAPPPMESQNSSSRLLAQQPTTPAVETPIPASPPPPPPASLQPSNTTSAPQDQADEDDDDDPTAIQPPAYRRRNFGIRPRVRPTTAPAAPSTSMSPRALEKQREAEGAGAAEDVPEEYMYLAGMMPPPVRSNTVTAPPTRNDPAVRPRRRLSVVEQDRDDEDEGEDVEEDGEQAGEARREDVTAHLATDDKAALARLHQSTSAPSAPPALDSEDEDEQDLRPVVPAEEEIYGLEGSGSSSHLPPPPSPPPPATLLPAPPAITSAHLFIPPPPPHEPSDLPQYVAGPSAPSLLGLEKLSLVPSAPEDLAVSGPSEPPVLPSAPPAEIDQTAVSSAVVPSAPPMLEDGEVQQALAPSAPPLEDDGHAGPSAPSRAA